MVARTDQWSVSVDRRAGAPIGAPCHTGGVGYAREVAEQIYDVARTNRFWMSWNLALAFVPAVFAIFLFWRPHRRSVGWWAAAGVFALFLPNAPYVLTDIIHLRVDATLAKSDAALVFGVLPMYALFVLLGMGSYLFCMEGIIREVRSTRPATSRSTVELPVHALCALGIVIGRIARLNSWDTITQPAGTLESVFTTLTWRGAPVAFVCVFFAVWLAYTVVRALVVATSAWGTRWATRFGLLSSHPGAAPTPLPAD